MIARRVAMKIKEVLKNNYKYWLFLIAVGIVGGIFTGFYTLEITDPAILEEALLQVGGETVYILISTMQVISYALIFGILGKFIAGKAGLLREVKFDKKTTVKIALIGLVGGALVTVLDTLIFASGADGEAIKESLRISLSLSSIIASFTYGGIIEEIMMRLFLMSLIALLLWKIFSKKSEAIPAWTLVIANVLTAMLFAAGHLPATAGTTGLTPMIVLRCFLFNGGMGLIFGRAYRKHGIHYAMLSHIFAHVGMKLISAIIILV